MSRPSRRWVLIGAGVAVPLVAFVVWYFQPQALFISHRVDMALPTAASRPSATASGDAVTSTPSPPSAPVELARGGFTSLEHTTSGQARMLRLPDGSRYLRLENLQTSNGPDVHVVLSPVAPGGDDRAYGSGYLELGSLQGNQGNQNYEIPAGTDLTPYASAVIYCERFTVGFGVAPLTRAPG